MTLLPGPPPTKSPPSDLQISLVNSLGSNHAALSLTWAPPTALPVIASSLARCSRALPSTMTYVPFGKSAAHPLTLSVVAAPPCPSCPRRSCCPYLPCFPIFLWSSPLHCHCPFSSQDSTVATSNTTSADHPNTWINGSPHAGFSGSAPQGMRLLKFPLPLCNYKDRSPLYITFWFHGTASAHALVLNVAPLTTIQSTSRTPHFVLQCCAACRQHHYLVCFFTIFISSPGL